MEKSDRESHAGARGGSSKAKNRIKPTKEGKEKAGAVGERNEISLRNSQIRKTSPFKFGERKLCG